MMMIANDVMDAACHSARLKSLQGVTDSSDWKTCDAGGNAIHAQGPALLHWNELLRSEATAAGALTKTLVQCHMQL